MASLSQTFDTTRAEIVAAMEQRIDKGDRTKLTKKELEELIAILVAQLTLDGTATRRVLSGSQGLRTQNELDLH